MTGHLLDSFSTLLLELNNQNRQPSTNSDRAWVDNVLLVWHALYALWAVLRQGGDSFIPVDEVQIGLRENELYSTARMLAMLSASDNERLARWGELWKSLGSNSPAVLSGCNWQSVLFRIVKIANEVNKNPNSLNQTTGSLQEWMLSLHPIWDGRKGEWCLTNGNGNRQKKLGAYFTPADLVEVVLDATLKPRLMEITRSGVVDERGVSLAICDPACGTGNFLVRAAHYIAEYLYQHRSLGNQQKPEIFRGVVRHCIFGVDKDPVAAELCRLNLWIEMIDRDARIGDFFVLRNHIKQGDSLLSLHPSGGNPFGRLQPRLPLIALSTGANGQGENMSNYVFDWEKEFPEVFSRGGFDVVVGNPPWVQVQFDARYFFASKKPEIARIPLKRERERAIQKIRTEDPALYQQYIHEQETVEQFKRFVHQSGQYPLTGNTRLNLSQLFVELSRKLIHNNGYIGMVLPVGILTDLFNQPLINDLIQKNQIISAAMISNHGKFFPNATSALNFCLLILSGHSRPKKEPIRLSVACREIADIDHPSHCVHLSKKDLDLLSPRTGMFPSVNSKKNFDRLIHIYQHHPTFYDQKTNQYLFNLKPLLMFRQNLHAHLVFSAEHLEEQGCHREDNRWVKGSKTFLPLYEAKMIAPYNHRYATWETGDKIHPLSEEDLSDTSLVAQPRYWISEKEVNLKTVNYPHRWFLTFREITNAHNKQVSIFAFVDYAGLLGTLPYLTTTTKNAIGLSLFCANANSEIFNWIVRQKISGTHLSFFVLQQIPIIHPDAYSEQDKQFVLPRVLELSYTSWALKPYADDLWDESSVELRCLYLQQNRSNHHDNLSICQIDDLLMNESCPLPPFVYNPKRRFVLLRELDQFFEQKYLNEVSKRP